jgi:hypothetical protein
VKKRYCLLPFLIIIALLSCSNPKHSSLLPYFDLQGFMNGQIKILTTGKSGVIKHLSVNDKKEVHQFISPDWQQELQPFIDADINKPAWRGNFNVDTAYYVDIDTEKIVTYTTNVPDIRTKKLVLYTDIHTRAILEIEADNRADNVLYHFDQQLFYFPLKKYFITTYEKVVLMNPSTMKIDGKMIIPSSP